MCESRSSPVLVQHPARKAGCFCLGESQLRFFSRKAREGIAKLAERLSWFFMCRPGCSLREGPAGALARYGRAARAGEWWKTIGVWW